MSKEILTNTRNSMSIGNWPKLYIVRNERLYLGFNLIEREQK